MRPRKADASKPPTAKKTPPARKTAAKTQPAASPPDLEVATLKTVETKRGCAGRLMQARKNETTPPADSKAPKSSAEGTEGSAGTAKVAPAAKVAVVKKVPVKRLPAKVKTLASAKFVSPQTPKLGASVKAKAADVSDVEVTEKKAVAENVGESAKKDGSIVEFEVSTVENVGQPATTKQTTVGVKVNLNEDEEDPEEEEDPVEEEDPIEEEDPFEAEKSVAGEVSEFSENELACEVKDGVEVTEEEDPIEAEKSLVGEVSKSSENEPSRDVKEGVEVKEGQKEMSERVEVKGDQKEELEDNGDEVETCSEAAHKVENSKEGLQGEDVEHGKGVYDGDEQMEEYGEKLDLGEHREEELPEDDAEDPAEETKRLADEHKEFTALANEHKMRKEREIFLGGLDQDAVEEDVRRVFERIGGIVEVRLHKNPSTNRHKGYAFVEFENKEYARRALSEMKNPVIRGKRCGTAPSEDNDTLFVGNICNTWTKEAIKQKLNDYGVEGVENINLVPDVQSDGLSRGFAFIEFSCRGDAMLAYKRLQQPDAIFGHAERTAKVAFAEPIREPDPEIMSQVKSVFVDGLPPHWDEDRVREQFKCYGEILRVVVARNMSTAKRKDFGFVDFSTHDSAVAFVDSINNIELVDGNSKVKVKARLSNPLPKTQTVKGGMCGGFRIGRGGGGSGIFSRSGRGFARGGHHFNRAKFQPDRHFYRGGRGQTGRMGFPNEYDFDYPYEFHGRGGRRGSFRDGRYGFGGGASVAAPPSRPYTDRPWHDAPDRGYGMHIPPRRHPYSPGQFDGPFMGGHFDEPYFYNDNAHGIKRPFHMRDYDHDYSEPSSRRPRLDYTDPAASFHGNHYRDTYGARSSVYPHDYYGPGYNFGPYSSYFEGNHSYAGGRYY
ncbi:nucleolin-like [Pyrus ussuriensis x Pyrus communis]|uniref:Nucleolin-like n=1 Tax=Pyrus ussuriensis x Pyrus communis TaxID=2448454 RepID=A0A5N5GYI4_9ROSA|nr:nucleolin-like [Pyrus ussuriensis x Pyrus communis]